EADHVQGAGMPALVGLSAYGSQDDLPEPAWSRSTEGTTEDGLSRRGPAAPDRHGHPAARPQGAPRHWACNATGLHPEAVPSAPVNVRTTAAAGGWRTLARQIALGRAGRGAVSSCLPSVSVGRGAAVSVFA